MRDILLPSFKSDAPQPELPYNPQDIMGVSRSVTLEAPPKSVAKEESKKEEQEAEPEKKIEDKRVATKPSSQIPNDQLDKTFTHTEISESGFETEYEPKKRQDVDTSIDLDGDGVDVDSEHHSNHASGVTIEDMNRTTKTLNRKFPTQQESRKAAEIIDNLRGTDLISQWRDSANPQVSKRISEMLDRCEQKIADSFSERTITKSRKVKDDFNLDNYIR
ncbi:MAG: hypothetical protein SNH01_09500 [Rikenellaceae bacterium]